MKCIHSDIQLSVTCDDYFPWKITHLSGMKTLVAFRHIEIGMYTYVCKAKTQMNTT